MRPSIRDLVSICASNLPIGNVLEVGSFQVQPADLSDMRPFFPEQEYIGIDMRPGSGVDVVADFEGSGIYAQIPIHSHAVALCLETLEHVKHPWVVAQRIAQFMREDGWLLVTVPFAFPIHDHPAADYWRFTPSGLRLLLEDAGFLDVHIIQAGAVDNPHTVVGLASPTQDFFLSGTKNFLGTLCQDWARKWIVSP